MFASTRFHSESENVCLIPTLCLHFCPRLSLFSTSFETVFRCVVVARLKTLKSFFITVGEKHWLCFYGYGRFKRRHTNLYVHLFRAHFLQLLLFCYYFILCFLFPLVVFVFIFWLLTIKEFIDMKSPSLKYKIK